MGTHTYYICDVDEPDWGPIQRLADRLRTEDGESVIEPAHFMYMVRIHAKGQPDIHLYKHIDTRRYINLDDDGNAYIYVPGRRDVERVESGFMGRYRLLPDIDTAIANLDLHILDERYS